MSINDSKKGRVLVVDDEQMVRDSIRMALVSDGYDVETAVDGKEALAKLDVGEFTLIMLDFEMPGIKGDLLAKVIKQRLPRQPIIMLSAYGETLRTPGRALTEVDLLMDKPFSLDSLREGIAKVFAMYADPCKGQSSAQ
jgi:CheY-like chemotaxis protein